MEFDFEPEESIIAKIWEDTLKPLHSQPTPYCAALCDHQKLIFYSWPGGDLSRVSLLFEKVIDGFRLNMSEEWLVVFKEALRHQARNETFDHPGGAPNPLVTQAKNKIEEIMNIQGRDTSWIFIIGEKDGLTVCGNTCVDKEVPIIGFLYYVLTNCTPEFDLQTAKTKLFLERDMKEFLEGWWN